LGVVDISTLGFSTGHPLSCTVAVICKVPTVGEYYPPPLITPVASSVGLKESRFTCDLKVSSPLIIEEVVGYFRSFLLGFATVVESAPSLPTFPTGLDWALSPPFVLSRPLELFN
jgi:hypothetical protein